MNCFTHQTAAAVALCKNCHKAVCPDCVVEAPNGITCSDACKEEITQLDGLIQTNKSRQHLWPVRLKRSAYFLLVSGLAMGYFGMVDNLDFLKILGGIFIIYGLFSFYSASKKD